jgi:hypothetical protein
MVQSVSVFHENGSGQALFTSGIVFHGCLLRAGEVSQGEVRGGPTYLTTFCRKGDLSEVSRF